MPDEKQIRKAYRRLTILRDEFSDEIPTEEIMSGSKNNRYKCRIAWWCMIRDELDTLEREDVLPAELRQNYHELWKRYTSKINEDRFGVKPKDITDANELISRVLEIKK